jgi:hypothetical protein
VRVWDLATGELAAGPLDDWAAGRAVYAGLAGTIYTVTEDTRTTRRRRLQLRRHRPAGVWDLAEGSKISNRS